MPKELLVNVSRGEEVRVALVEDGRLEEIYLERDNAASNVGNIYLGKVTNVEGSIQAAFIDFGYGRNGFLHVQDLHPDHFPDGGKWDKMSERVGKKIGRRDRPPIQDCLRRGDRIVVQIIKEGIGTKGPTLTSYPSIPGRFLVAMPGVGQMGVSKNIEDETERRRLRKVLDGLEPPKDVGFIIRTAGEGKAKLELERDFKYLSRVWGEIDKLRKKAKAPALLYSEGDLVTRTVRDVWSNDVDRVIVDDPETAVRVRQFFKLLMPRTKVEVQLYEGTVPLFHATGLEREIETMFSRHVPMANGGSLVIDSTEAIVAIDVNTGKFREHGDAEETAFRMDLEAADEICRQLRLRDLGGIVICDFIDLRFSRHREALFDRLTENFKRDRAKSRHLMMSEFGIVEITRQRMRPDLRKSVFEPCPWSRGTGFIKTPESLALDLMRKLRVAAADDRVMKATARLFPRAALHVLNTKRDALARLERRENLPIEIRPDESLAADQVELDLVDADDRPIIIDSIRHREEGAVDQGGARRRRRGGRGRSKKPSDELVADMAIEVDRGGLMLIEALKDVDDLTAEDLEVIAAKAEKRDDVEATDPMRAVLEALSEDEDAEEDVEEEVEEKPAPSRRRGRGRGRGRASAEERTDDEEVETPEPEDRQDDEEPAEEKPTRGRRRRRGRRSEEAPRDDAESETPAEEPAPEDQEQPSADAEEEEAQPKGRRRRRRRGRRSEETEVTSEPAEAEVDSPPAEEAQDEEPEAAEAEAPAEPSRRRRRRRGKRSSNEEETTHVEVDEAPAEEVAEPVEEPAAAEADEEEAPPRRRRRRSTASPDPIEPKPAPAVEEPEPEPEPEAEVEAEPDAEEVPTKRRRRSRGKLVKSRPIAVATAVPAVEPESVEEPEPAEEPEPPVKAPKKAAKRAPRKKAAKAAKTAKAAEPDDVPASDQDEEAKPAVKKPRRSRKKATKKSE